jgi:hypothetical protein
MTRKLNFLKNALLGLLFVSLFSFSANAQWTTVGAAGFTAGSVGDKLIAVYNDTIYVAFEDGANSNSLSVMKYDGTSWTLVGQPGFSGGFGTFDFKISNVGEMYIAYSSPGSGSGGITVMKYANGTWANVGVTNLSNGGALNPNLAIDSTGVPYVGYYYDENAPISVEIRIQKFDGTNWVMVGNAIGTTSSQYTIPNYPDVEFDDNGKLYVAYSIGSFVGGPPAIQEFDGSSWNGNLAVSSFGDGFVDQLIFDSNQIPYIIYGGNNGGTQGLSRLITPITSVGGTWQHLGTTIGTYATEHMSVAIDDNDKFYVLQVERIVVNGITTNSYGTSVYTFDGTSWVLLGNNTFRAGLVAQSSLTAHNNVLYIAFSDTLGGKATVQQYDLNTSINQISTLNKEITIYPNPTKAQLTIEGVEGIESIRILTMDGKVMQTIRTTNNTISVEALPQGIYTIEVMTTEGVGYKNFIKQ